MRNDYLVNLYLEVIKNAPFEVTEVYRRNITFLGSRSWDIVTIVVFIFSLSQVSQVFQITLLPLRLIIPTFNQNLFPTPTPTNTQNNGEKEQRVGNKKNNKSGYDFHSFEDFSSCFNISQPMLLLFFFKI